MDEFEIDGSILEKIQSYCAYQERCHSEVRYKLIALGARGQSLEAIISVLIADNFLNEERYAKAIVRGKLYYKHWGRYKIIQLLKQKQVSAYCIQSGLKEIDEAEYYNILEQETLKKLESLKSEKNKYILKQKVSRYVIQRGFESDLVQDVINAYIQ